MESKCAGRSVRGVDDLLKKIMWNPPQKRGKLTLTEAAGKASLERVLRKKWLTIIIKKGRMFQKGGFLNVV